MNIKLFEEFKIIGGQELYSIQLMESLLSNKDINLEYITSAKGNDYIKLYHPLLVKYVKVVPIRFFSKLFFFHKNIYSFLKNNKKKNIIISNSFKFSVIVCLFNFFIFPKKTNKILTITHLSIGHLSLRISNFKLKILRFFDRCITKYSIRICISKEIYSFYQRDCKNIFLIENCLSKNICINTIENDKYTSDISFIGRIDKQKGIDYLYKLIKKIYKDNLISKIEIAGTGDLKERIIKLEKLSPKIKFYDFIADPFSKIKSRIILFPSLYEGFPLSILEAVQYQNLPLTSNIISYSNILPNTYPFLSGDINIDINLIRKILKDKEYRSYLNSSITKYFTQNYSYNSWQKKWRRVLMKL